MGLLGWGKLEWYEEGWARQGQREEGTLSALLEILLGEAYSVHQEPRKRRVDRLRTARGRARMDRGGRDGPNVRRTEPWARQKDLASPLRTGLCLCDSPGPGTLHTYLQDPYNPGTRRWID